MPNQMHGKNFENLIKASNGMFTSATADRKRSPNERFDIGEEDDRILGIPTSIKSSKGDVVALSDARKFWESFNYLPYRIIVGRYKQTEHLKAFFEIHEIILQEIYRDDLLGSILESEICEFHNGLREFKAGPQEQSRASSWAQKKKLDLDSRRGLVTLNPKIDSKNQRRLQCSISLKKIVNILEKGDYILHDENFGILTLPLLIKSGSRTFS